MLSKKFRFRNKKAIDQVFLKGKIFSKGFMLAKILHQKSQNSHIAFSVGLGFSKKAVRRNSLRRTVESAVKNNLNSIKNGYDIVFFPRKGMPEKFDAETVRLLIQDILNDNNLLKK